MVSTENQVKTATAIVQPIFQVGEVLGRHQINGKAKGPTQQTAITMVEVRKYQGIRLSGAGARTDPSRNSPQCLHLMAAS